ncbi:MAG TPA: uracil phosphoribosyltransferase [Candidatus Paceibacterota bacterium]|nr:uracil phosphoribosyltransferase [Candidatus Paceibacterota bacterium]
MAKLLKAIRDRELPMWSFRHHSHVLADYLIEKLLSKVPVNRWPDIVPVLVFRASLVFLHSIAMKLPNSPIGFVGLKRDERTLIAEKYYSNLPKFRKNSIIVILDPMLGTAGTLRQTYEEAVAKYERDVGKPIDRNDVYYVGFLAAESGYQKALELIPPDNVILLVVDPEMDANGYIAPGLGDFGDRYFG